MEKSKKKFKLSGVAIFNIIVGIITVGLLVYFIVSDGGIIDLFKSKEGVIWWVLVLGVLTYDLSVVTDAVVTCIFLRSQYPNTRFLDALKVTCVGVFFSAITPSNTGGQPMQILMMSRSGIKGSVATSALIQKFLVWQFTLAAYCIVAVVARFAFFKEHLDTYMWVVSAIGFAAQMIMLVVLLLASFAKNFTKKISSGFLRLLGKLHIIKNTDERGNFYGKC